MATITSPLSRMRYLIARSDTFRTWVGATVGDEAAKLAAALDDVYLTRAEIGDDDLPAALVEYVPNGHRGERIGDGGGAFWQTNRLKVSWYYLLDETVGADSVTDQLDTFDTDVRAILNELAVLSGAGTHLYVENFTSEESPYLIESKSELQAFYVAYNFECPQMGSQSE